MAMLTRSPNPSDRAEDIQRAVTRAVRAVVKLLALLPSLGARVLALVARLLGGIADRSRELADDTARRADVPPPGRGRRRKRAALWFAGGFASGAVAGIAASEWRHRDTGDESAAQPWPAAVPDVGSSSRPASG